MSDTQYRYYGLCTCGHHSDAHERVGDYPCFITPCRCERLTAEPSVTNNDELERVAFNRGLIWAVEYLSNNGRLKELP